MASFLKRGDSWRAIIRLHGVSESRTFSKKALALTWAASREAEIRAMGEGRVPDITFAELLTRFQNEVCPTRKGAAWERIRIRAFLRQPFAKLSLRVLSPLAFTQWRDERLREVSPGTVIREMGLLSSVCAYAVRDWRILHKNPMTGMRKPPAPPARDRRISPEESERILFALGYEPDAPLPTLASRVGAAFLFAIETAMRAGEIRALTAADVDLERRVARVRAEEAGAGKTRAARRDVPLSSAAVRLIRQLPEGGDTLFALGSATVMDATFRKARSKAGITDLHFHDTRHEAITRLANKLDVLALARAIGHRDLRQLMVYYNESAEALAKRLD